MDEKINNLWDINNSKKCNKYILGPMIRASSLPLRLTSLYYNPNIIVYSEEIPSHRLSNAKLCRRVDNHVLNTIDFIEKKEHNDQKSLILFRTHKHLEKDRNNCILQLSASDPITVLKAAQAIEKDVAAIDINMGCPKFYSISRNMGSALLKKPELAEDIIKTLRRNLTIPICVKTRLQSIDDEVITNTSTINENTSINLIPKKVDLKRSNEWLLQLQAAGANAITIHMRTSSEKTCHNSHTDIFPILYHSIQSNLNTPLVYNGDIWSLDDVNYIQKSLSNHELHVDNNDSKQLCVMISRGGLWDASIFQRLDITLSSNHHNIVQNINEIDSLSNNSITMNRQLIKYDLISNIIKFSALSANCIYNTRYLLQQILASSKSLNCQLRTLILKSHSLYGLVNHFNIYDQIHFKNTFDFVKQEKRRQTNVINKSTFSNNNHLIDIISSNNKDTLDIDEINSRSNDLRNINVSNSVNNITGRNIISNDNNNQSSIDYSEFYNSRNWPGIVNITSHSYDDSYFDKNYYTAFHKCCINYTGTRNDLKDIDIVLPCVLSEKRLFTYSGYNDSVSTIIRVNKKIKN